MKKILTNKPFVKVGLVLVSVVVTAFIFVVATRTVDAASYSLMTSQVQMGDRGTEVTNLQMFLSADPSIYPEGLVTGYFGPLTRNAVMAFQSRYGIIPVGRVGPITIAKINSLISNGQWSLSADVSGPQFYSVNHTVTPTSATFSWTTNEDATAKVFYNTSPILMNWGDINSVGLGPKNGWTAVNDGVARKVQQVTINSLQPNTQYRYMVVATDKSGNVSVFDPNGIFKTNQ